MATYLDMVNRCASELHRSDITSNIKASILSAISYYESSRFFGNETRGTITTIAGNKFYGTTTASPGTLPTGIIEIDSITVTVNNRIYQLDQESYERLEAIDAGVTPLAGYPRLWAWYSGQIRLYPTPNSAYLLTISYQQTLPVLSADTDSNFWTNDAEELIRNRAKKDIALSVTMDDEAARRSAAMEIEVYKSLKAQTNKLVSSNKLSSTPF